MSRAFDKRPSRREVAGGVDLLMTFLRQAVVDSAAHAAAALTRIEADAVLLAGSSLRGLPKQVWSNLLTNIDIGTLNMPNKSMAFLFHHATCAINLVDHSRRLVQAGQVLAGESQVLAGESKAWPC